MKDAKFEVGDIVKVDGNINEIRGMRFVCSDLGTEGWQYYCKETAMMRPDKTGATHGTITRYYWVQEDKISGIST